MNSTRERRRAVLSSARRFPMAGIAVRPAAANPAAFPWFRVFREAVADATEPGGGRAGE